MPKRVVTFSGIKIGYGAQKTYAPGGEEGALYKGAAWQMMNKFQYIYIYIILINIYMVFSSSS